jgi:transposase
MQLGVGRVQVSRWRERYARVRDLQASSATCRVAHRRPRSTSVRLVELTTQTKPKAATHWSTRTMAAELGVSAASVSRHWRANGLKPHLVRGFKVSRDPLFVEKLEDIVGLYMSPPEHALVLCCDEKSQVQALDRTQARFAAEKGARGHHDARLQAQRHDHAVCCAQRARWPGHRPVSAASSLTSSGLKFLRQIERETPKDKVLHLIVDNYATHKHPAVIQLAGQAPSFQHALHADTSASWLNMVERFFRDITDNRLRRGVFSSVAELDGCNRRVHRSAQHQPQAVHLDQERSRHPAKGHSCQQSLKF